MMGDLASFGSCGYFCQLTVVARTPKPLSLLGPGQGTHISLCSCCPISAPSPAGTSWLLHQLHLSAPFPVQMRVTSLEFNLKGMSYSASMLVSKYISGCRSFCQDLSGSAGKQGCGQDSHLPGLVSGSSDLSRLILGKN